MFARGFDKIATDRLLIAAFAPSAGAIGGALAHNIYKRNKKEPAAKTKKDRENAALAGTVGGVGVSAYQFKKFIKERGLGDKSEVPHKSYAGQQHKVKLPAKSMNTYVKRKHHPAVTRVRGNVLKVDFSKKPGFASGVSKFIKKV